MVARGERALVFLCTLFSEPVVEPSLELESDPESDESSESELEPESELDSERFSPNESGLTGEWEVFPVVVVASGAVADFTRCGASTGGASALSETEPAGPSRLEGGVGREGPGGALSKTRGGGVCAESDLGRCSRRGARGS